MRGAVMMLTPEDRHAHLATFTASLADVPWLSNAGEPTEAAIVADDLVDAWDEWNSEMLAVWRPQTSALERVAVEALGEDGVNFVFDVVSRELEAPLRAAIERYYDECDVTGADRGLWPEWLDTLKRDLCWAAVEAVMRRPGFFTNLLPYYRAGRWPCAWEAGDRGKRVVLL